MPSPAEPPPAGGTTPAGPGPGRPFPDPSSSAAISARRLELAATFDGVARLYDRARPHYPDALFDDLAALAGLGPGSRLLEVGAGTGRATLPLAERGCRIVALEPGANLAALARARLGGRPDVEVRPDRYETYDAGGATFDCLYAATAWHWTDPAWRYVRAARLLRPGGSLAVWNTEAAFPDGFDPFFTDIQAAYAGIGAPWDGPWPPPPPERVTGFAAEIEASGLFGAVQVRRHLWVERYDADGYVALLDTFSNHRLMRPEQRGHLHAEVRRLLSERPDGMVTRHWLAVLCVASVRG